MDANQVVTYNLLSNNDILHVDIGLEFDSPIAGGLSVSTFLTMECWQDLLLWTSEMASGRWASISSV